MDASAPESPNRQAVAGMLGAIGALIEQITTIRNIVHEARTRAERESASITVAGQKAANDWLRLSGAVGAYTVVLNLMADVRTELLKEFAESD